jgi:CBS domain-containing protein
MAQSIREVMTSEPISISADAAVVDAAQAMRDSDIGDVLVLDDTEHVCGIVTDRDIAVRLVAERRDPFDTTLGEICSHELVSLAPDDTVEYAVKLMSEKAIRRLPVVESGRPIGIVSLGDLAVTRDPDSALADISEAPPSN